MEAVVQQLTDANTLRIKATYFGGGWADEIIKLRRLQALLPVISIPPALFGRPWQPSEAGFVQGSNIRSLNLIWEAAECGGPGAPSSVKQLPKPVVCLIQSRPARQPFRASVPKTQAHRYSGSPLLAFRGREHLTLGLVIKPHKSPGRQWDCHYQANLGCRVCHCPRREPPAVHSTCPFCSSTLLAGNCYLRPSIFSIWISLVAFSN